jgi:nucleotide-binding universal stress UspA family protein
VLPIRTILHPTDFSEHSRYAFQTACVLARECHARLIVLHVVEPPVTIVGGTAAAPLLANELPLPGAERHLHRVRPSDPDLDVEHQLEVGYPAETILRVARELPADLIVMGTHGRRGLSRLLMGSVAERVLREAGCPILTLKQPARDKDAATNAALRASVEV